MILALLMFLDYNFKKLETVEQGYLFREINGEMGIFLFHSRRIQKTVSGQFAKRTGTNSKDFLKCYSCLTCGKMSCK